MAEKTSNPLERMYTVYYDLDDCAKIVDDVMCDYTLMVANAAAAGEGIIADFAVQFDFLRQLRDAFREMK